MYIEPSSAPGNGVQRMNTPSEFAAAMQAGYAFSEPAIDLGGAILNGECPPGATVRIPLRTMNRHGLIAGATGTGKTKTLQVIAEQLALNGVPSLLMDIKGDLSGIAAPGTTNPKIDARQQKVGIPWQALTLPVEFLSLSKEPGAQLRATTSEFGPVLLGRILELNDTQASVLSLVFKYCDDNGLPLLDIQDLRSVLQYIGAEGKEEIRKQYGQVSPATVSTIMRKLVELEQQGADGFFGERSFDVQDLLRQRDGKGVIHVLRLTDIQDRPRLFSTFMLCLLAEVYGTFPEVGDADKPKLVIFIDEAHLIFDNATKPLLDQVESIIKLIRSKGVGIHFCTQDPSDVPESVLGQLGLKVQHSLRAFTAKDRTTIKKTAQNYPITPFYDTEQVITSMGIGEALVSALNVKGVPTPLAWTLVRAPGTRMDVLSPQELQTLTQGSELARKYNERLDRESASELLAKRVQHHQEQEEPRDPHTPKPARPAKEEPGVIESISKNTMVRQLGRTAMRELARGLLGVLGLKSRRR
jgi:DNA helicase HerA-like ATPase